MKKIISDTIAYMDYLLDREGLLVSVHFSKKEYESTSEEVMSALLPYRSHNNPYCRFVTSDPKRINCCFENHKQILQRLHNEERIVHTCFAAASEVAYPIRHDNETVGFVAVSGYKGHMGDRQNDSLWQEALSSDEPPTRLTDVLIPPLCAMLERVLTDCDGCAPSELSGILKYISDSPSEVSLDKLSQYLGRSRSYVSHFFKKKTGKSLRAYCNDLKLVLARKLLVSTDMSVTEIAFEVGFDDTSYFIRLFKEKYGVTPHKYKKTDLTS